MTLAISIAALAIAGFSLAWQIWSWARSGPRVKVSVVYSSPVLDGYVGKSHVVVQASNTGRAATTVEGFGFEVPGGFSFVVPEPATWSAKLPYRLEPHASAAWHVSADQLAAACRAESVRPEDLRAWVQTVGGRKCAAKGGVKLPGDSVAPQDE